MVILEARNLSKRFRTNSIETTAVNNVSISIGAGEFIVIRGASGSGKSTLLSLLGTLERPDAGELVFDGTDLLSRADSEQARIRGSKIGFIFQSFQLAPHLTAAENVMLPLVLHGMCDEKQRRASAVEQLARLGLSNRDDHFPDQLSGGQQQRVAIARALITKPALILADEPTGNLDSATSEGVARALFEESKKTDSAVVVVTHEDRFDRYATRLLMMSDGAFRL